MPKSVTRGVLSAVLALGVGLAAVAPAVHAGPLPATVKRPVIAMSAGTLDETLDELMETAGGAEALGDEWVTLARKVTSDLVSDSRETYSRLTGWECLAPAE